MKNAGYATASIGKWHLGGEEYYPDKHGFDINIAGTDRPNTEHYFSPYGIPTLPDGPKGEYVTDRLTTEAIRFMGANRRTSRSFCTCPTSRFTCRCKGSSRW